MTRFKFIDYGTLSDGDIEVAVRAKLPADIRKGYVPSYEFDM